MDGAAAKREIRDLLWEWDFIGVRGARSAAPDEYDCLLGPLYGRLVDGADAAAIGGHLRERASEPFRAAPDAVARPLRCEADVMVVRRSMRRASGLDARGRR